jgi:hypothetical protein
MRANIIVTMALAGLAMGGSGCRTKPEAPHTWVTHHVTIEPLGQKGEWSAEETGLIKDTVEGAAKSFGLKRKRAYKLPDLIGWKDPVTWRGSPATGWRLKPIISARVPGTGLRPTRRKREAQYLWTLSIGKPARSRKQNCKNARRSGNRFTNH